MPTLIALVAETINFSVDSSFVTSAARHLLFYPERKNFQYSPKLWRTGFTNYCNISWNFHMTNDFKSRIVLSYHPMDCFCPFTATICSFELFNALMPGTLCGCQYRHWTPAVHHREERVSGSQEPGLPEYAYNWNSGHSGQCSKEVSHASPQVVYRIVGSWN